MRTLKRIVGVVTSTGMDRTAVVMVPRLQIHGLTRKILNTYTKCFAHDHHEVRRAFRRREFMRGLGFHPSAAYRSVASETRFK
jgi:hypothetical protein